MTDLCTKSVDNPMNNPFINRHQPTTARDSIHMRDPKPTGFRMTFYTPGCHFEACREAEAWCEDHGISVGAMECDQPRGLIAEGCIIAKWSNLRPHERATLNGTMTGNMRSGPVTIELRGNLDDYPLVERDDFEEWADA